MRKIFDEVQIQLATRLWIRVIQLDERLRGQRGNTRFRRCCRGHYTLETDLLTPADEIDGKAWVSATGSMTAIADFLVAREKRRREAGQR